MVRAVLFDLDGTLFDRATTVKRCIEHQHRCFAEILVGVSQEIGHYFETILILESEGIRKPDATIFNRALSRLSVRAGEAMFVGDHPIVDVQGAKDANDARNQFVTCPEYRLC
jgi:FMN phosphatase YigB (HAD superfamily)